jgi:hypothetical protein
MQLPSSSNYTPIRITHPIFAKVSSIISVHGLMGKSFSTWTDQKTKSLWLRDFLPEAVPSARIMTFGYDAAIIGRSVLKLDDVASNLIAAISSVRGEEVRNFRLLLSEDN